MEMRRFLTLVQVVGALALVLLLYAWVHPDSISRWSGRHGGAAAHALPHDAQAGPAANAATRVASAPAVAASAAASVAVPAASTTSPTATTPPPNVTGAQWAVAHWVGGRYGVAPDAIAPLVAEADVLGRKYRLSPNLLIAVMAIESNFHPYIQSQAGAQGLMQVMPQVHSRRYEKFGGKGAFVDPIVSLRVGAEILRDCIKLKDGSEAEGLRFYFGGGPSSDTYIEKVRAEQQRLNAVARGTRVPQTD